jgi:hypothetical protein
MSLEGVETPQLLQSSLDRAIQLFDSIQLTRSEGVKIFFSLDKPRAKFPREGSISVYRNQREEL